MAGRGTGGRLSKILEGFPVETVEFILANAATEAARRGHDSGRSAGDEPVGLVIDGSSELIEFCTMCAGAFE